jgi:hypothetical protein
MLNLDGLVGSARTIVLRRFFPKGPSEDRVCQMKHGEHGVSEVQQHDENIENADTQR